MKRSVGAGPAEAWVQIVNVGFDGPSVKIPLLGLGVYQVPVEATMQAVSLALQHGYRHIDTAHIYGNERAVGLGVKNSGIPREEVFITTKLWDSDQGYQNTLEAFNQSLKELGVDYVDLYLVHTPSQKNLRLQTWEAMEAILKSGKAKSIGVSNYGIHHLKELFAHSKIKPSINQLEIHPFNTKTELVQFCEKENIVLEAYSPLTRGQRLDHPTVVEIAKHYVKSPAQILLRWALQKNFVVLPKSINPLRVVENAQVFNFEISSSDMANLDSLNENLVTVGWDPTIEP
ncbi:hypothetical protein O6H91_08G074800 [Diphasiastrum complanatum]|uniref:Uncharacterized protein n=2 Tax=Diphasiastrum complanatum TaxID=34168 RepID=A0ACC2CZ31_DIPCM|nr:hypothetical protein O6H91_08G074500 [Diphasiastrum complanatum]KAJ7547209.1 hypothetical protein O6H91_08G074800 [Diphasiastrum complanatum]